MLHIRFIKILYLIILMQNGMMLGCVDRTYLLTDIIPHIHYFWMKC